ncbi:hypothetical protein ATE84_4675 [Aquimarina sp. MAR_2010_214]|uniref:hypothetical protein n=1 Tax=Aquimarina sp. MAR_2010_214 TaxID=1250026 RepID=UPI000C6FF57A|nr:hypothetical protein [Aquimarina sp. MAR_2010_214]PKV52555.1 hypothetical protein ATE84_4675 [Aquimarina sp. MAR_2010_214]
MKFLIKNIKWINILAFWGILNAILEIIWLYYETGNYFKSNHYIFLLVSVITAVAVYVIIEIIRQKSIKNKFTYEIRNTLHELESLVRSFDKKNAYFPLLLINWRLKIELSKVNKIKGGEWNLNALKTYEYLRNVFGSIISLLNKGDEYITLSNLDFWSEDRYGATDFVTSNLDAAKKGVIIKRIIIIDEKIIETPQSYPDELSSLLKIIKELKRKIGNRREDARNMQTYFYLSKNYDDDARPPVPFAIIYDKTEDRYISMLPSNLITKKENPYVSIKLKDPQNDHDVRASKDRFHDIYSKTTELMSIDAIESKVLEAQKSLKTN